MTARCWFRTYIYSEFFAEYSGKQKKANSFVKNVAMKFKIINSREEFCFTYINILIYIQVMINKHVKNQYKWFV